MKESPNNKMFTAAGGKGYCTKVTGAEVGEALEQVGRNLNKRQIDRLGKSLLAAERQEEQAGRGGEENN